MKNQRYGNGCYPLDNTYAVILAGGKVYLLDENESTYIPKIGVHRLENPIDQHLKIIEVQCGQYIEEGDIERLKDDYARLVMPGKKEKQ